MKDDLAVFFSGLCLIHCVLTPLIVGLGILGTTEQWFESEWVHIVMLVPVALLAVYSLPASWKSHGEHLPIVMASLGIAALCSALFLPENLELLITAPAATMLILAHAWNRALVMHARCNTAESADG